MGQALKYDQNLFLLTNRSSQKIQNTSITLFFFPTLLKSDHLGE
jgi:hypothetical protein